jgi:hypothetical protein
MLSVANKPIMSSVVMLNAVVPSLLISTYSYALLLDSFLMGDGNFFFIALK